MNEGILLLQSLLHLSDLLFHRAGFSKSKRRLHPSFLGAREDKFRRMPVALIRLCHR